VKTLGIDIGGTSVKWVVLDLTPETPVSIADGSFETRVELGPAAVLERIAAVGHEVIADHGPIDRVGIGVPGPLDLERGRTIFLGNFPGWEDAPVVEPLERMLGLSVGLINDARAYTLAEHGLGAGRGCRTLVGLTIGTGIGGGVVVDGQLLLGMNGTIGELGHQAIVPDGPPCGCGSHGCLEALAAGPAIARAADMATPEDVVDAARAGDRRAGAVLEQAGIYLGIGIANVVLAVGPERVVVGGGVAEAGELILRPAREELARRVTVMPLDRIAVVTAELGTGAGAIGAALWGAKTGELAAGR
jgi:glucokinase